MGLEVNKVIVTENNCNRPFSIGKAEFMAPKIEWKLRMRSGYMSADILEVTMIHAHLPKLVFAEWYSWNAME